MASKKKLILIQHDDFKSKAWRVAAVENNYGQLICHSGSPLFFPFIYLQKILFKTKPDALVFRYIGDYKSMFLTIIRLFSEVFTIGVAKLHKSKILWICHNVDKETHLYYPLINKLRRKLIKNSAKKIFVLDSLLINHAQTILKVNKHKLDDLCFGNADIFKSEAQKDAGDLAYFDKKYRKWIWLNNAETKVKYVGLWIGAPAEKLYSGLKALSVFFNRHKTQEPLFGFVIIGKIGDWLQKRDSALFKEIQKNPRILFINKHLAIEADVWHNFADFVWKPCNDLSVNMTAYNAALNKLPIIGMPATFFGTFIEHYKIGFTIDPETTSWNDFVKKIKQYNPECADRFLENKTWGHGAKKMFDSLDI